jgi:Arc/MetJ-type ribon-helix-helix transcriptional regulator
MDVPISEHWQRFVGEEVRSGRFPSEAAVLEEALTLLAQRERASGHPEPQTGADMTPIGKIIDELMADLPSEVLDRLPVDGAAQHDHYIYGTSKRPS